MSGFTPRSFGLAEKSYEKIKNMMLKKIICGSTLAEDARTILSNSINNITLNCEIKQSIDSIDSMDSMHTMDTVNTEDTDNSMQLTEE